MKHRTPQSAGFTLMELIVALAIVAFMVFAMHSIFNEAVAIVRRGTQTGEIIQRARGFNQQIRAETAFEFTGLGSPNGKMVGPLGTDNTVAGTAPGGFLMVIQNAIPNVALTDTDASNGVLRPIRSDQLMFIVDQNATVTGGAGKLRALAPATDETFGGNANNSGYAPYARLWYGHVKSLRRDGTTAAQDELGDRTNAQNPNAFAVNWVLGRQALFLTGVNTVAPTTGADPPLLPAPATNASRHYADGFEVNSPVVGYPGKRLSDGMSDVSNRLLSEITGAGGYLSTAQSTTALDYHDRVLTGIGFGNTRLLTQAKPGLDLDMTAEQFAPMHTAFMTGVSDFIVEWAGDMYQNSAPGATVPTTTLQNTSATYSPDGLLDRVEDTGEIVWYSHLYNNSLQGNPVLPTPSNWDPDMPITWLPPGGNPASDPYKPTDARALPFSDGSFVWQHEGSAQGPSFSGAPANAWPWLIRIRYRLHDRRGEYVSRRIIDNATDEEIEERGQWFSVVFPVNRQFPLP